MRRSSKSRRIRSARGTVLVGDEAFETLAVELYQIFLGRLEFRTGSPEAAQDLVQEIFLRLWRKRQEIRRETASAFAWSLLRDSEIDWHRREKVRRGHGEILLDEVDKEGGLPNQLICQENPLTVLDRREMIHRAKEKTRQLPANQRRAVKMTVFEGRTIKEAARRLKASEVNVRKWISRGLAELRVEMSKLNGAENGGGGG